MRLTPFAVFGVGVLAVLVSTATPALAGFNAVFPVPEIDAASISTGVGLLAAGILIVRARTRK